MAGSGDLVGGRYPLGYSFSKAVGLQANAAQGNISVRSNLEWLGINDLTDAAASLVGGEATVVAVPVEIGDEFATAAFVVGNTAASTPTHQWAQVYAGTLTTAAAIGTQSADGTTAVMASKATYPFALGSKIIITPTNAPYGYVYVAFSVTGTAVPSLSGGNIAVNCQFARFADAPPFWAGTYSSALGATAPASITLASVTAIATVPEVYLY